MTKRYRLTLRKTFENRVVRLLARYGRGPAWRLTTMGRRTGERRDVMITPVTIENVDYLVAPYGDVSWVLNLRATDRATLARGSTTSRVRAVEIHGEEAGRVLARYYHENRKYVAAYFDLAPEPTVTDFTSVAGSHPVFRVEHPL
ncbi:MAG: nitroreductase/quinone reductase family protein [Actinomycetota bacterium]|nr:nitroreductase/quinone reductase family protein [Actinomycetota bacterium]